MIPSLCKTACLYCGDLCPAANTFFAFSIDTIVPQLIHDVKIFPWFAFGSKMSSIFATFFQKKYSVFLTLFYYFIYSLLHNFSLITIIFISLFKKMYINKAVFRQPFYQYEIVYIYIIFFISSINCFSAVSYPKIFRG